MAVFENFMEDVIIIAVQKFFLNDMCILCGEEVNINGQFAECTTCHTIQLAAECEASYSARVMLKDATGTKKMMWIHDEHIMNICGVKNKYHTKINQIVHVTVIVIL
jgi:hypothetical protein